MGILSRHIASEFTKFFLLLVLGLSFIVLVGNLFSRLGDAIGSVEALIAFIKETIMLLPMLFELILPITVLLATVATFNTLSKNSEITAMKAAGMGWIQFIYAILVPTLVIAAFSYLNQNYLYPYLQKHWGPVEETTELPSLWMVYEDQLLYFGLRNQGKVSGMSTFAWDQKNHSLSQYRYVPHATQQAKGWLLEGGVSRAFEQGDLTSTKVESKRQQSFTQVPKVSFEKEMPPKFQPIEKLYGTIQELEAKGQNVSLHWVEFYQKLANPMTILIMALIGLSLSISHSRKGKAAESTIGCLFLAVLFWMSQQIFLAVGGAGALSPFFAAWFANITFLLVACLLFYKFRI